MRYSSRVSEPVNGGPALFRLVRFWSRRWASGAVDERAQHVMAVEAVHAGGEATVNDVAHRLGLDQSGASRIVRAAVAAGYLARGESQGDRRRAAIRLTPAGEELLAAARSWQRDVFDELTAGWKAADRHRFAGYLDRLADEQGA
ncbi:MarR family winged helix-turn-helix transcriptional regulator [Dactylosporangium roseum]